MLRTDAALKGCAIAASDGEIGTLDDILFDEMTWQVRWFVVDTGGWLGGRRVLVRPIAVSPTTTAGFKLSVKLTRAQIEASPDRAEHEPLSRQMGEGLGTPVGATEHPAGQDPHLRSAGTIDSYRIFGTDGEVGHLSGLLIDDVVWEIRYLFVDTRNWRVAQDVLIAPAAVAGIDWSGSLIRLDVTRGQISGSPAVQSDGQPEWAVPLEYERRLHAHYNWPGRGW